MTLRDEIRKHFDGEAGRYPAPAGLRASVTSEATSAAAIERRPVQWAAAVAVVLAVAIVAALLGANALLHARTTPGHTLPSPKAINFTPSPGTNDMTLVEVDLVDSSHGWALLFTSTPTPGNPSVGLRHYWVSRTTDGGATWSKPAQVMQEAPGEGDSGHHLHFVDPNTGFAYGNTAAMVTHDGGRTWASTGLHFLEVEAVVGRSPWTWVVLYPCAKGTVPACPYQVYLSHDAGLTWAESWALPGNASPGRVVAFGDGGLLISNGAAGGLYMTSDGGKTWRSASGQCSASALVAYLATSDGRELWQACSADFPDATAKTLFVSEDAGATWVQRTIPVGAGTLNAIASSTPGTCFLATDGLPLAVTRDGGVSWAPVSAPPFRTVVFGATRTAWAIDSSGAVWASTDGGSTWTLLSAQP